MHALFVAFVVLGQAAILYGLARRRSWARNPLLRTAHLLAITRVVLLTWFDSACPLTVLENRLRRQAGQAGYPGDFIGYWLHELLFLDCPRWGFALAYSLFGLAVLLTYIAAPPRWRRSSAG
jgi:hypothetical protein